MEFTKTAIEGVVVIEPTIIGDERGYFCETFRDSEFRAKVCDTTFVQDNQSKSTCGVLRGLHFQSPPHAQSKLVRVVKGRVLDVAVDIRKGSPTYGRYEAIELSEANNRQLFIPRGFAHGFLVLSDVAVLQYRCDNYYNRESEGGIIWSDPDLGIDWGVAAAAAAAATLSAKDETNQRFEDFDSPFRYDINYYE